MILLFHGVEPQPKTKPHMESKKFESLLKFITRNFEVVPLKYVNSETVAITFDDGYSNNFEHALPILKKYNVPATIFVLAAPVEIPWWHIPGESDQLLTKHQLEDLSDEPLIEIGCHGYFHEYGQAIIEAKNLIESVIGKDIEAYSFPYGNHDERKASDLNRWGFSRLYGVQNCIEGVNERICISNTCNLQITKAKLLSEFKIKGSHKYFDFSVRKLFAKVCKII